MNNFKLFDIKKEIGPFIIYDKDIQEQSKIYLSYDKENKRKFCAKIINQEQMEIEEYQKQIIIHQKIQYIYHENILRIYQVITQQNVTYIFQELCDQDLAQYMDNKQLLNKKQLGKIEILDFISQISNGYQALIQNAIIHRDIKPQNILLSYDLEKNKIIYKICDFNVSKTEFKNRLQTPFYKGTFAYLAPEVISDCKNASHASDAFSFGLVLFEILTDQNINDNFRKSLHQFLNSNDLQDWFTQPIQGQQKKNQNLEPLNHLKQIDYSNFFIQILNDLLQYQPEKRIKWGQLKIKVDQELKNLDSSKQFKTLPDVKYSEKVFNPQNSKLVQSEIQICSPQFQQHLIKVQQSSGLKAQTNFLNLNNNSQIQNQMEQKPQQIIQTGLQPKMTLNYSSSNQVLSNIRKN
ncbi:unnamed protein product [Paramecium sonneborni]|uniref:Protein kinase domain-containing protein n=1 Tax=Paramecium sonneborni TaxID=65129 RepID=A0A8S1NMJ6_9CILI|nr:unnamed protein product [Paramecium sonneborni]